MNDQPSTTVHTAVAPPGSPTTTAPRRSALFDEHVGLGAKLTDFGGWEMPLSYPDGTIAEHRACRTAAAVFDVSHLGTVRVAGPDALARLQGTLTNDLARIGPGRAQYTHLLDDDGSVVDDLIVWWLGEDAFDVMPNASNTSAVLAALGGEDTTGRRAVLAVQGPSARALVGAVLPDAARVARFAVSSTDLDGAPCLVAGTGYTGEDGLELAVPAESATALWRALVAAGAVPAGLGARDTLRLEAGLPLHGHELGPGITPLQAGLGWVVAWGKPAFRGRDALVEERAHGPRRHLVGVATDGRRPPRAGDALAVATGAAGVVTSGNFSPMLGHGIALALVDGPAPEAGTPVRVDARREPLAGRVAATPFVRPGQFALAGAPAPD